jgi:hypothetical protein
MFVAAVVFVQMFSKQTNRAICKKNIFKIYFLECQGQSGQAKTLPTAGIAKVRAWSGQK